MLWGGRRENKKAELLCETIDLKGGHPYVPKSSPPQLCFLAASLKIEKPRSLARFIRGEPELRPIAGVGVDVGVM